MKKIMARCASSVLNSSAKIFTKINKPVLGSPKVPQELIKK